MTCILTLDALQMAEPVALGRPIKYSAGWGNRMTRCPEDQAVQGEAGSQIATRGESLPCAVDLSVIIPCYQEATRLADSLRTICAELDRRKSWSWEVLVIDDGSTDGTADLVEGFDRRVRVVRFPRNRGKGAAVRAGMLHARGRLRLMTDADLSTPITELDRLVAAIEGGADIAIGRRTGPHSRVHQPQPWYRQLMGKIFNLTGRLLFCVPYQDTQCGFKLFSGRAAEAVFRRTRIDRFAFDFEAILLARQLRMRLSEVYVLWNHVDGSRVRLVADSASMFWSLVKLRFGIHR
jgi:dolichyl-phosphate beta-glucosyltransferase